MHNAKWEGLIGANLSPSRDEDCSWAFLRSFHDHQDCKLNQGPKRSLKGSDLSRRLVCSEMNSVVGRDGKIDDWMDQSLLYNCM
jgi:hypothetical protein